VSWPRKVPRPSAAQDGTDPVGTALAAIEPHPPVSLPLAIVCRLPATAMVSTSQGILMVESFARVHPAPILRRSLPLSARQQSWAWRHPLRCLPSGAAFSSRKPPSPDVHRAILARQLTATQLVNTYLSASMPITDLRQRGRRFPRPAFSSATSSRSSTPASSTLLITLNLRGKRSKTDSADTDPNMRTRSKPRARSTASSRVPAGCAGRCTVFLSQ